MRHLLAKFADIGLNRRVFSEDDFYRLCRRRPSARSFDMPLRVPGFYMVCYGKRQIYLNSRQSRSQWLEAAFHELAHHLMHTPANGPAALFFHLHSNKKEEFEAQSFAALALIPKSLLETNTFGEIQEEYSYSDELLWFRKELYELYRV